MLEIGQVGVRKRDRDGGMSGVGLKRRCAAMLTGDCQNKKRVPFRHPFWSDLA